MPLPLIGAAIGPLAGLAGQLIDNLFETDEEKANAKAKLMLMEQQGKLQEMNSQMSAILAEANSKDPWTSRARPTFLYLIYTMIIICMVGGIIGIWYPMQMAEAAKNMGALLNAIPESLYWLFGAGYLGYTGGRSFDKWKNGAK
jgi:hypothetical protein